MSLSVPQLKMAVQKFLCAISSRDHVTLLAFNDSVYTLTRREADPAASVKAVDRLSAAWGGTSLYDVVVRSFDQVSKEPGRHAVVVFTDGEDRSSLTTLESVEARIKKSDATLFAVSLGRGPKVDALKAVLERLTAAGGRTVFTEHADKLDGPFGEIVEELSNQYLLGYEPTNRRHDGTWRRITVETINKRHRVRARQGYTAESK